MKYFAKYLPVEDEIKVGDMALKPAIPHLGINEPYVEEMDADEIEKFTDSNRAGHKFLKGSKKVKLFLCSRDIQVGEDYKFPSNLSEDYLQNEYSKYADGDLTFDQWFNGNIKWINTLGLYKVIGDISPEATWVKEGDEFDEEKWRIRDVGFNIIIDKKHEKNVEFPFVIELKGPCGHFH